MLSEETVAQPKPIRVLVVEDSPSYSQFMLRMLEEEDSPFFQVRAVGTLWDASAELRKRIPDAVLLDLALPDASGLVTVAKILALAPAVPIVVISGTDDEMVTLEAVRGGAQDYLVKGRFDRPLLVRTIRYAIERAEAAEALRRSEERYALAVNGARDGLWDWDLRTGRIYFSPRWKAILGCSGAEIGAQPEDWLSRIDPEDRKRFDGMLAAHFDGRAPELEVEYRMVHRDLSTRWVLTRGIAVRDPEGKPYRIAGSQTDVTERNAFFDALTGLASRSMFVRLLGGTFARARRRSDYQCAVIAIDLDRFAAVTEGLGHTHGDQALVTMARRIEGCLRAGDTLARMGSDEFAVLLDDVKNEGDGLEAAERILEQIRTPLTLGGETLHLTACLGVAPITPACDRAEALLRDSETAMKFAKTLGKGRIAVFDVDMRRQAEASLKLESELRRAIERREFALYFQPIVSVSGCRWTGAEVLVRWLHPERGVILPGKFIPLAEETGLIVPLGEWILRSACIQNRAWMDAGRKPLVMAVNISPIQFMEKDFVDQVRRVLAETRVDPKCLEIEITEGIAMKNVEFTIEMLRELAATGVKILIDDFGTGYSSLSYLQRFPVTTLKLDRSFVSRIPEHQDSASIVSAIIAMGHSLGLSLIAEGVETEQQKQFLQQRGCDEMQGFLFGEAQSAAEFERKREGGG